MILQDVLIRFLVTSYKFSKLLGIAMAFLTFEN